MSWMTLSNCPGLLLDICLVFVSQAAADVIHINQTSFKKEAGKEEQMGEKVNEKEKKWAERKI